MRVGDAVSKKKSWLPEGVVLAEALHPESPPNIFLAAAPGAGRFGAVSTASRRRGRKSPREAGNNETLKKTPTMDYFQGTAVASSLPTTLFFMRSHAQSIVLACHRTRWLVHSWASTGPALAVRAARDNATATRTQSAAIAGTVRAAEGAVRLLSLAVDHLSYLRTAKPYLAGCVAYWLWERGGVRAHTGELARATVVRRESSGGGGDDFVTGANAAIVFDDDDDGESIDTKNETAAVVKAGRPAREAFLAAAEEFLHVEALFTGGGQLAEGRGNWGGNRGGVGGGGGEKGRAGDVSFLSLLTAGTMEHCPWPGAWDRWVEECLRDAQVRFCVLFAL